MECSISDFSTYEESVPKILKQSGLPALLAGTDAVLVKPNLVNATPFPVTTRAECCAAVVQFVRECSRASIVIAEGCGEPSRETTDVFRELGYQAMAESLGVDLVDLNHAPLKKTGRSRL